MHQQLIKDVLLRLNLPLENARGQCYDGCSTMTEGKNGVAAQIKRENPKWLLTHCFCHALNLACGDTIRNVSFLEDTLDIAYEVTKLVKKSPKRDSHLKEMKQMMKVDDAESPNIKLLCATRWTVRAEALKSISENYAAVLELWDWSMSMIVIWRPG